VNAKLLLVDDVETNRFLLEEALADTGLEILSADGGERAIEIWASHHPEIALVDLQMPGVDGAEVARRIKSEPAAPFTYVLIVSGFREAEREDAVRSSGADRFLGKPYTLADLRAAVDEGIRLALDRRAA
jgi:two-component system, cell cycle response regulator